MTFAVTVMEHDKPKKLGTIWADEEGQAHTLARELFGGEDGQVVVKRAEEREIPLTLPN